MKLTDNKSGNIKLSPTLADAVMTHEGVGLRGYAVAGGLDPASDFQGLDLRGWDLSGQDLRGFNLSDCDLRDTNIELALTDYTTDLRGASFDTGVDFESRLHSPISIQDVEELFELVKRLSNAGDVPNLVYIGRNILPLIDNKLFEDNSSFGHILSIVSINECRLGFPLVALEQVEKSIAARRKIRTGVKDYDIFTSCIRAEALRDLGKYKLAMEECNKLPILLKKKNKTKINISVAAFIRATLLQMLNRPEEALIEIRRIVNHDKGVRDKRSFSKGSVSHVQASIINDLGRHDEALSRLDELLKKKTGSDFLDYRLYLQNRSLKSGILISIGDYHKQEEEMRDILDCYLKRRIVPFERNFLRSRYRLAHVLYAKKEIELAQKEISATIAGFQAGHFDPNERWFKASRHLLDAINKRSAISSIPA